MNAGNAYAWRMLGTAHAENDDDQQAIAAMAKALSADPDNPAVLLALGVSHVNELQAGEAVRYLMRCGYWCCNEKGFVGAKDPPPPTHCPMFEDFEDKCQLHISRAASPIIRFEALENIPQMPNF
jgi:hypothetical protein